MSKIVDEPNTPPTQLGDNRNGDSMGTPSTGDLQNIQAAYQLDRKNYSKWTQFV